MKRLIVGMIVVAALVSTAMATPLIGRGAGTLKPLQFLGELDLGYTQTAKRYDWTDNTWKALDANQRTTTLSGTFLLGFAPIKRWELLAMVPVARKTKGDLNSFGIGDVELHTRYALITGRLAPLFLTGVAGVALPTADKNANPKIGDGKFAGALGLIAQTRQIGMIIGHLRGAYWLNGKTDDTTRAGNMMEYSAKVDLKLLPMLEWWLAVAGTMQARTEIRGTPKEKTEQDRHVVSFGAVVKPIPMLFIRPKAGVPLAFVSKGGAIPNFTLGLDFWVVVP